MRSEGGARRGQRTLTGLRVSQRIGAVREVGSRRLRSLAETPYAACQHGVPGGVIRSEELSPAGTALMDPRRVAGFAAVLGGSQSHTAIMARALSLPAVLGAAGLLGGGQAGGIVGVDGPARPALPPPTSPPTERDEPRRGEF